jgi:hypothetical protein
MPEKFPYDIPSISSVSLPITLIITDAFLFASFAVISAIRICFLIILLANCKKERKEPWKLQGAWKEISDECFSKVGFFSGAEV